MKTKRQKRALQAAELAFDGLISKNKQRSQTPKDKGYKYICKVGHIRIERQLILERPFPFCSQCHMTTGEMNRIKYKSQVGLPKLYRK